MKFLTHKELNDTVTENFSKVKLWYVIPALLMLILPGFYFLIFHPDCRFTDDYVGVQKDLFFYLNKNLSEFPRFENNITQLGDVLIFFSFLTFLVVSAPKLWKALLTSAILSLLVSAGFKKLFAVPRPAATFDHDSFVIIGKTLSGHNSLPSGHSIATFLTVTILLYAFMPKKFFGKVAWTIFMLVSGFVIAISRVGVGAHYPLDVASGCIIGFTVSVIGIVINNKTNWGSWMENTKFYPIFMVIVVGWIVAISKKIYDEQLLINYFCLVALIASLFLMINVYVKRKNT